VEPRPWTASSVALFGLTVLAWGGNYLFVRVGLAHASPIWLATFRAGLGLLGFGAYLLLRGGPTRLDLRAKRTAFLLGIPNTAVFFGLWFGAARSVPAGQAAVVIYTFPLWVALLSIPVLRRRLTGSHWALVSVGPRGHTHHSAHGPIRLEGP